MYMYNIYSMIEFFNMWYVIERGLLFYIYWMSTNKLLTLKQEMLNEALIMFATSYTFYCIFSITS